VSASQRRTGEIDSTRPDDTQNPLVHAVLSEWLTARGKLDVKPSQRALFVGRKGTRLSPRAADAVVRRVASDAGLILCCQAQRGFVDVARRADGAGQAKVSHRDAPDYADRS